MIHKIMEYNETIYLYRHILYKGSGRKDRLLNYLGYSNLDQHKAH